MLNIEQRVEMVEERMGDHSQLFMDLRQSLLQFEARVDARFGQVETRLAGLDQKVDSLRRDMGTQFHWMAGIVVSGLVAIVAALLAR